MYIQHWSQSSGNVQRPISCHASILIELTPNQGDPGGVIYLGTWLPMDIVISITL